MGCELTRQCVGASAGVMEGTFLDDAGVRRLEKLPTKKELIAMVARLIKQARMPVPWEFIIEPQACHSAGCIPGCGAEAGLLDQIPTCKLFFA